MYSLAESLRAALQAIRFHILRATLTVLGMVIGVAAVITVVALLQGMSQSITTQFKSLGSNGITIVSYLPKKAALEGKTTRISPQDLHAIVQEVRGIHNVVPVLRLAFLSAPVRYHGQSSNTSVTGTTSSYAGANSSYPVNGRFISPSDNQTRRPVAIIGKSLIKDLGLPANPDGQFIQLFGNWFKVVGVLNKLGTLMGMIDLDNQVYIPYGTARSLTGTGNLPNIRIMLQLDKVGNLQEVEGNITRVLRRRHHLRPGEANDFKFRSAEQLTKDIQKVFNMASLILGGIVSIALLVGGIGIMNVMLVSVTERTREIGILKSLGATRRDILLQFLIEAVLLSLLGGLIGLFLGYGVGQLVVHFVPAFKGAVIPGWVITLALGFTASVGLLFGIAPAARAASLDPIDALRYE